MRFTACLMAAGLVAGSLTYSPSSHANVEQLVASMCDYVAADDKNRLRKKLKDARIKLRSVYDGVSCNGNSLLRTAMLADAQDVGVFLVKQLPRKSLSSAEADGQTVLQWAEAQGLANSAIAAEISSRAN
ncbi:conserved hypothetical protein [Ferrimonas balearica DSM 9799]|uniref:DUF3718 domain-containing protein n=2 Tax=Ferrimonas balearica TaxID=44012 RepID=E1SLL3_FERBD|nr:DUF3718 domain-containing protein [Ferrimonas balearica]ADN77564.1 conserved hypothetical protein [Ferrimonas balearica DSM 9799]MBY5981637.1 DUF3718 domain-containing protein [Ferrimonas balearica]